MANPQIKQQVLQEFGLDPRKYWLNDDGDLIAAPDGGAVLDGLKSAAYNAPRTALGFVGGAAGAVGGGALGALGGPAAPVTAPVGTVSGAFAGGAAGSALGEKLQDLIYPESWKAAQEARVARHPTATFASDVGAGMLLMRPSPKMLGQVLRSPAEFLRAGGQVSPATRAALLETGVGGALEAGGALAQGGSAGDVGLAALIGAVNSQPTRLGTMMSGGMFQPWRPGPSIADARMSVADSLAQRREAVLASIREAEAARMRSGQEGPAEPEPTRFGSAIEEETGAVPTEGWNQFWAEFMPRMRARYNVRENISLPSGEEAAGSVDLRRGPDVDASVNVSERGYLDTAPHETAHLFIDDILNYGNPRERRFVETALRELGLEVEEVGGRRRVRGIDAEEGAVQSLGEMIARRVAQKDVPVLDALRDFADYYLRNRMTPEAAQRMLSGRILHGRGTAPSLQRAAKLGVTMAPPPAEEVRSAEPAPEPTAEPASTPDRVITSAEAERVQVARERARRMADLEAAFAERDAAEAERRLRASIEALPESPEKARRRAELEARIADEHRQRELETAARSRTVRGEEGESALTAEERLAADAERFADIGGEPVVDRPDVDLTGFAEPDGDALARRQAEERAAEEARRRDFELARAEAEQPAEPVTRGTSANPPAPRPVGSVRRGSERVMRRLTPEKVTPGTAVARPEERDITGQGFARSMLQQKANKQNERESAEDLEMRRLEDRLAGRDRSRYQPMRSDLAYHAGDLGYARDTVIGRMGGRSTGHFGTGTYFVSRREKLTGRGDRPVQEVDLSGYNLAKPKSDAHADMLHNGLRTVNSLVSSYDTLMREANQDDFDVAEHTRKMTARAESAAKDIAGALGKTVTADEILAIAKDSLDDYNGTYARSIYAESASTRLMRKLGFDGVDVRHLPNSDNTMRGTVVYGEKFVPRTQAGSRYQPMRSDRVFATDFEKELANPRPFKIQVAKDGRMSANDLRSAIARLNPTERELLKAGGIDRFLATTPRPSPTELSAWARENLPQLEVKELRADSSSFNRERERAENRINDLFHEMETRGYFVAFDADLPIGENPVFRGDETDPLPRNQLPDDIRDLIHRYEVANTEWVTRYRRGAQNNDSATRRYSQVNPRELADMPGAVDLLVRIPRRKVKSTGVVRKINGKDAVVEEDPLYSSVHYPQSGDNLLAHARAYEHTMPDGERVLRVFEVQSDWAQERRKEEARYSVRKEPNGRYSVGNDRMGRIEFDTEAEAKSAADEYADGVANHPLLPHVQRLALKAAIEHARKRGIKRVVVDDAETAMLTEGHDRAAEYPIVHEVKTNYSARDYVTELPKAIEKLRETWPADRYDIKVDRTGNRLIVRDRHARPVAPQERGMRLAYDNVLQQMMRDMVGDGVKVELGEHKNAIDPNLSSSRRFTNRAEAESYAGPNGTVRESIFGGEWTAFRPGEPRKGLIFRNPDGTPKTTSTGIAYDVSAAQARRDAGEPFTVAGRRYQPMNQADVLEVARSKGYTVGPIYHGTTAEDIKRFRQKETGIWAAFSKDNAQPGSGDAARKILNLVADPGERPYTLTPEELDEWRRTAHPRNYVQNMRARHGATSIRIGDYALVVFKPEQLKSADEVTYDNKGQVIDIEDRFDKTNKDIRYQPLGPERGTYGGVKLPKRDQPPRGLFAGNVEALRRSKNPDKAYFADRAVELYANIRANIGRYEEAIMKPLLSLKEADRRALVELMYDEDAQNKSLRHTLAARIQPVYDAVRAGLKLMRTDQNAANHLIDGKPAGIDPLYFPNILDPSVLHDLSYNKNTPRYNELRRQFVDYNAKHFQSKYGMSAGDARLKAEELFGQFSGTLKPASIEGGFDFGPVTLRANSKLPPTWVAADPVAGFRAYIKRFSRARAFYDTVQRDERTMQLIGSSKYFDSAGMQQDTTPNSIATDPNVRVLLEDAIGVTHESQEAITPAIGRLANTLLLSNLATRLTDAATTPFKMLAYLPATRVPGYLAHLANIRQSIENAYKTGGVRRGDMMVMRDVLGAGDAAVRGLDVASQFITKYTGSELLEKGARFLAQNAGEYVYDVNSALARGGDKRALDFMNRLTPQWRTLPRAEVAQRIAQLFQGSYDATNLPIWIKNSPAAPFFSMLKWNVEQWNNFKRFAWQPLTKGDPVPMIRTLVGGLLGGLAVGELREMITGKKQRVAEFSELADALRNGVTGAGSAELLRKLAFLSQVTGTLGVVGEVNLQVMDILAKDKPQGFSWPAYELARTIIDNSANAGQALAKRPDDAAPIMLAWANGLLTSIFSQYRVALNAVDRATGGAATRELGAGSVEESNRRRDLRVSQRLRGEEVRRTPYIEQDLANVREREFDRAESPAEIVAAAKKLRQQAAAEARTPEDFEESKRKFRAQRIAGIPSADNDPQQYAAHIGFVRRTQGDEAARELHRTYMRLRARQRMRSELFK